MADKQNYNAPPDSFPHEGPSSGSGTNILYSVEARLAYHEPRVICGHLLDLRWRAVYFEKSPIGVPSHRPFQYAAIMTNLMNYQAAQALRWWFIAQADIEFSCGCVETRLIEHKVEYQYNSKAIRAVCMIGGGDDRSHIMPVEEKS